MLQFVLKIFLTLALLIASGWATSREVLVQERPVYKVGEVVKMQMPVSDEKLSEFGLAVQDVGPISIRLESIRNIKQGNRLWMMFRVDVTLAGMTWSENWFMDQETSSSHFRFGRTLYRIDTDIRFPLYAGDTFTSSLMKSGPCPSSPGTCMQVIKTDECYGTKRVSEGIEYICSNEGKRTRYVLNTDFKWPVKIELLE